MDTKATVDVGEYSRYGRSRGLEPVKALDHDMRPKEKLVPGGILEIVSGRSFLFFTSSYKTSDFMVDGLLLWWNKRKQELPDLKHIVINLDNGPECSGRRSQFLKRMVEFSDITGLTVRMIYYPPYHSKYNPVERCWGILENHWNGSVLDTVEAVIKFTASMTWNGLHPVVELIPTVYPTGVSLTKEQMNFVETQIARLPGLEKWFIDIAPSPLPAE